MYTVPFTGGLCGSTATASFFFGVVTSLIVLSSDGKSVDVMTFIQIKSTLVIGSTWYCFIDLRGLAIVYFTGKGPLNKFKQLTNKQTNKQTKQTIKQTNKHTHKQTNKQKTNKLN